MTTTTIVDAVGIVEVEFRAANDLGDHPTGTAVLDPPVRETHR